jgi:hypothetical protein
VNGATTVEPGISDGPRKGQTVTLRQVTRLVPARAGSTRQIHALTSDLAAALDDPDRMVPNPAREIAAARVKQAEAAAQAAYLSNQVINALAAPVEGAWRELDETGQAAAAIPARVPLGGLAPDMVRLDAETKQITHAIRMAA